MLPTDPMIRSTFFEFWYELLMMVCDPAPVPSSPSGVVSLRCSVPRTAPSGS